MILVVLPSIAVIAVGALFWPLLRQAPRWVAVGCATITLSATAALYAHIGNPGAVEQLAAHREKLSGLSPRIAELTERTRANANDVSAWVELSLAYREQPDLAAAALAMRQAVLHSGGNPDLIAIYGETLVMRDGGTISPEAKRAFDTVLTVSPTHSVARYYQGLYHLQSGNREQALNEWRAILPALPADSPLKLKIEEFLR